MLYCFLDTNDMIKANRNMTTPENGTQVAVAGPTGWNSHDIAAAVRKTGITLSALSQSYGLSRQACSTSLRVPCPAADRAIATRINVPLCELWPYRYDAAGNRIGLMRRAKKAA